MNTDEVARAFTALCRQGAFEQAGREFWSDDVVSVEPMQGDMAVAKGREAVEAKGVWWYANHEVHGVQVGGPFVNGDQFALRFTLDFTPKGGQRTAMEEIGLYTVRDGKITEERFFYGAF